MNYFVNMEVVKFKLKPEFDSDEFKNKLHTTADGFYVGVYYCRRVLRNPEVKRDGQVVVPASQKVLPEGITPMLPSGAALLVPNFGTQTFETVMFTMDKVDEDTAHPIDHTDHMPPGRVYDPAWKPDAQRKAEEAAAAKPATVAAQE